MDQKGNNKGNDRYRQYRKTLTRITELFRRYLEGQADEKTRRMLDAWDPDDIPERYEFSDDVLEAGSTRVTNNVFSRLGINPEEEGTRKPARRRHLRIALKRLEPAAWRKYAAIAVIAVVSILGSTYYISSLIHHDRQEVPGDNRTVLLAENDILHVTLPDGTQMQINKGSTLSYDQRLFNRRKREVWLEGEAYFDVAKDPAKLFIIHSDKIQTTVKGTSFNISAYKELVKIAVSVRTGMVEVSGDGRLLAELTSNERLCYDRADGSLLETWINWDDAVSWMDGRLVLQNAGIDEFLLRIRQLYGMEVLVAGDILKNEQIVISAGKETGFTDVMNAFCFLYDVKYKGTSPGKGVLYQ